MANGLSCFEKQKGEEAATPGQPVRARARCLESPRQFTLENHRLPLALPQSFPSQELSRFAAPTFPEIGLSRNTKRICRCEETVEDVSSLWKIEENEELTWANLNAVKL
jgi:hypothetical protein